MIRRKRSGMWLPPDLQNAVDAGNPAVGFTALTAPTGNAIKGTTLVFGNTSWGTSIGKAVPLIGDLKSASNMAGLAGATLADYSFGYSLQRVVGNIYVAVEQQLFNQGTAMATGVMVTAGMMVKRVDDDGAPITASPPQNYDSASDPWLWRRSWMLCNQPQAVAQGAYYGYPSNNGAYGSVREGTFVDQKTRRTVKLEERVFMVIQATLVSPYTDLVDAQGLGVEVLWDFRYFGRVFTSAGNKRNASR